MMMSSQENFHTQEMVSTYTRWVIVFMMNGGSGDINSTVGARMVKNGDYDIIELLFSYYYDRYDYNVDYLS